MPARRVGDVVSELATRLDPESATRLTRDNLAKELSSSPSLSALTRLAPWFSADIGRLTAEDFRVTMAVIRQCVRSSAHNRPGQQHLIRHYATTQNIVRTLTDRELLTTMARMDPVGLPSGGPNVGELVRAGHSDDAAHWEVPVSDKFYGSKLVTYFYVSGEDYAGSEEALRSRLLAHDSDEFVFYFGSESAPGPARMQVYIAGEVDPYVHYRTPIQIEARQWCLYDGRAPHFWYAPKGTVAFFASAAANKSYRKPVAFRLRHRDHGPGGSYSLFKDAEKGSSDRAHYVLGKRLRRLRDMYQLSTKDVEELAESGSITSNTMGKIEAGILEKLQLTSFAEYARAMDVTLVELLARDPAFMEMEPGRWVNSLPSFGAETVGLEPLFRTRGDSFAVTPFMVRLPKRDPTARIQFWEGGADAALVPLSGAVTVLVAPDPLILALELAARPDTQFDAKLLKQGMTFGLSAAVVDEMVAKKLMIRDLVPARHAYHFNAALPHALLNIDEENLPVDAIVVTTRDDRHLPQCWVDRQINSMGGSAPI